MKITFPDDEKIIHNYVYYLVKQAIAYGKDKYEVLKIVHLIYISRDYDSAFVDFAELYWAKDDLEYDAVQWYWPDATRENIDQIIMDFFRKWESENAIEH